MAPIPGTEQMTEIHMKKSTRAGAVGAGIAAVILIGSSAAYATHTKVSVNGSKAVGVISYSATNDTPAISFITNYGVETRCTTASIDSDIPSGPQSIINRGMPVGVGNTVATIGVLSFSGCTMAAFPVTVTMAGGDIEVRNHPTNAGDPIGVTITGINAHIESTMPGCEFDAAGTLDAVIKPGSGGKDATLEMVPASFAGAGSGFDLEIDNAIGCAGEVLDGDTAGSYYYNESSSIPSAFVINTVGVVTHN